MESSDDEIYMNLIKAYYLIIHNMVSYMALGFAMMHQFGTCMLRNSNASWDLILDGLMVMGWHYTSSIKKKQKKKNPSTTRWHIPCISKSQPWVLRDDNDLWNTRYQFNLLSPGRCGCDFELMIITHINHSYLEHFFKSSPMVSQHWFRQWLDATRH